MALAVQITSLEASGQQLCLNFNLVASGNYSTGGDTVDFTQAVAAAALQNPAWAGVVETSQGPVNLSIWSAGGNLTRNYAAKQGTALNNSKLKLGGATYNSELAAGAYPADVTGDTIQGVAVFNKLL